MANRPSLDELYSGTKRPSLDEIYSAKPSVPVEQPQKQGFFSPFEAALDESTKGLQEKAAQYNAGNIGKTELFTSNLSNGVSLANKLGGETLKKIGSGVSYMTPDFIENPVKEGVSSGIGYLGSTLADTLLGRNVIGAMDEAKAIHNSAEKNYPRATAFADDVANIGFNVLPTLGAIKGAPMAASAVGTGTKALTKVAAAPVKYTAKVAGAALAPKVEKDIALLAQRAQGLGIDMSLDQVAPTRMRNSVQKISQELPFSGVDNFQEAQRANWNKALAKSLGQTAEKLDPATINKFRQDAHVKFSSAIGNGNITLDPADFHAVRALENGLSSTVTGEVGKIVKSNIQQFKNDLGISQQGARQIPAQKLASLRSDLINKLPTIDSQARPHVAKLIDVIDDIAERNITPQAAETLKQARREWRNYKTVEPLLEKSLDGNINPTDLMNRVAQSHYIKASQKAVGDDDLVDLARIGKMMAKKGGSDTIHKGVLIGGGATLAGAVAHPMLAIQGAAALAGNRALQSFYNQSPNMLKAAINKSTNPLYRFYKP
jgi:hypothetical protein